MKIGYYHDSYPYKRNIINIVDGYEYVKVNDIYKYSNRALKLLKKTGLVRGRELIFNSGFSFNDFNLNNVDMIHFFNNVSFGKTPWVSTFETFIPRFLSLMDRVDGIALDNKVAKGLAAVQNDSCRKIIAISECSKNFQTQLLENYPTFKDTAKKLTVLHPPQKLFVDQFEQKQLSLDDEISFMFVGGEFFLKGGLEVIRVLNSLRNDEGLPIKLTIVSTLKYNDFASRSTETEYREVKELIEANKGWITHFNYLSNDKVIDLMKSHHVGMLPTWADTYGYSVLEFQATGCPVISTNVRALPEINNNDVGWVIDVPKDHLGEAKYKTQIERHEMSVTISNQIERIVKNIFMNKSQIRDKSNASIKRIIEEHNPEDYANKLKTIYTHI